MPFSLVTEDDRGQATAQLKSEPKSIESSASGCVEGPEFRLMTAGKSQQSSERKRPNDLGGYMSKLRVQGFTRTVIVTQEILDNDHGWTLDLSIELRYLFLNTWSKILIALHVAKLYPLWIYCCFFFFFF